MFCDTSGEILRDRFGPSKRLERNTDGRR